MQWRQRYQVARPDPNPIKRISCCGLWGNPGQEEFANAICAGGRAGGDEERGRRSCARTSALARPSTIAFLQIGALNGMHKPGRREERDSHPGESARRNLVGVVVIVAVPLDFFRAVPHKVFRVIQRVDPPPPDTVVISRVNLRVCDPKNPPAETAEGRKSGVSRPVCPPVRRPRTHTTNRPSPPIRSPISNSIWGHFATFPFKLRRSRRL